MHVLDAKLRSPEIPARKEHTRVSAISVIRRVALPKLRLFCFPYAGAGPSVYRDWATALPEHVELAGVVYPGRESRANERPLTNLAALVGTLVDEIGGLLDLPFAFFGHSMGAYVAFEAARSLSMRGLRPEHVFVSAAGAPHLPEPNPVHALDPRAFFEALLRLNGFPAEVLRNAELVRYALPILRADLKACETHRFDFDRPSLFPITAYGGRSDPRVSHERIAAWRATAGVEFALRMFDGDHFFFRPQQDAVLSDMMNRLSEPRR